MSELTDSSSINMNTNPNLIRQAQANESSAWEVVFALYAPLIKAWATQSGVSCPHEAENVCQEVFTKIVKNLRSFKHDENGSFRGWLRVITRNHILSYHLGNTNFQTVGGSKWHHRLTQIPFRSAEKSLFDSVSDDDLDEKTIIFRQIMEWIKTNYSLKHQKVFHRVVIDQAPAREVAEELNLTTNIVYQYKSRILARIRQVFKDLV